MYKTKKSKIEPSARITVSERELMELLSCGRQTAAQIGQAANAIIYIGRRKLYIVKKVKEHLNTLQTNGEGE